MKKVVWACALVALLLCGCGQTLGVHQAVYLDVFDTTAIIRGYDVSEEAFMEQAEAAHQALERYHRLFSIYEPCTGGVWEINENAGKQPVAVEEPVLALLEACKTFYDASHGKVNVAMGSVLSLWHDAREAGLADPEQASLPDREALRTASLHCSFDTVILDREAGTVFLADENQRLDLGAVAKGWAAQRVCEGLPQGYMVNVGGNVCTNGSKPDGSGWNIAVQHPRELSRNLCVVGLDGGSLVTSGDYQRYYTVEGQRFHHIIDPETLLPASRWQSVTVRCANGGVADFLSTALFLLPREEGEALAKSFGAEAMWVDEVGNVCQSGGFEMAAQPW